LSASGRAPLLKKTTPLGPSWRLSALAAGVVLVLVPTLAPGPGSVTTPPWCLICGERGGSDAIANTILFVPLGIALGFQQWKTIPSILFAFAITLLIETAQLLVIPGRDAGIGDLLFNTTGAAFGLIMVRTAIRVAPHPATRRVLQVTSGAIFGTVVILTGWLFQPDLEADSYRSQWTQWRSRRDVYEGAVHSVHLGYRELPDGRVEDAGFVRAALTEGQPVVIQGTVGEPPRGFGAIFTLRGQRNRDIWTAGQRGNALIIHYRPRAADFRLQEPDLEISMAMVTLAAGTPFTLSVARDWPGFHVELNEETYRIAFAARDGWRLFVYPIGVPRSSRWVLGYLWLAALAFPIGFWTDRNWKSVIGISFLVAGIAGASVMRLIAPPGLADFLAIAVGIFAGAASAWGFSWLLKPQPKHDS
jgi:hypothetical protein